MRSPVGTNCAMRLATMTDMAKKSHNPNPNGSKGNPVSLAPLSPDQALAGLLRVKPADVKRMEAQNKAAMPRKKRQK